MKLLGKKCFHLRQGYGGQAGGQVAFTKLDPGEIRRIKKIAFAAGAR